MIWTVSSLDDPIRHGSSHASPPSEFFIVHAKAPFSSLLTGTNEQFSRGLFDAFQQGARPACVALADFCSRVIGDLFRKNLLLLEKNAHQFALEPLEYAGSSRRRKQSTFTGNITPYIMERSDVFNTGEDVIITLRARVTAVSSEAFQEDEKKMEGMTTSNSKMDLELVTNEMLSKYLGPQSESFALNAMNHVATIVVQNRLREVLASRDAVAFIADGSILPRKSGANNAPMSSPPAVPCEAPADSTMKQTLQVDLGPLRKYLRVNNQNENKSSNLFEITGMLIPKGITLVAGGGYHGKSTLLRAIAAGVYDKIPGDGREFCVTVQETTVIRAEDGRYVNTCNISQFISNLPTLPGVKEAVDTTNFSSSEASGSTSQAANVSEAIEMGAKVFLVDEDVSAANFMARDGRMRALVMDESITPLLYRVNGMYNSLGISCIVVVGGVGDWLDVPDQVILMNKYVASDATKKAQSISYQFSYGHVQYAGKGVVHQLEWDKQGTPLRRKPTDAFLKQFDPESCTLSLLDGGHAISIHPSDTCDNDVSMSDSTTLEGDAIYNDDDDGYIDLSRCEQLVGKKPQLFACGQCVLWLIREAQRTPGVGVSDLLSKLDETIDSKGMLQIFAENYSSAAVGSLSNSSAWMHLLNASGFAYRPRKYEIGQAFFRMRGIRLEHIPVEEDDEEERIRLEAEKRKRELAELWAARRPKNVVAGE